MRSHGQSCDHVHRPLASKGVHVPFCDLWCCGCFRKQWNPASGCNLPPQAKNPHGGQNTNTAWCCIHRIWVCIAGGWVYLPYWVYMHTNTHVESCECQCQLIVFYMCKWDSVPATPTYIYMYSTYTKEVRREKIINIHAPEPANSQTQARQHSMQFQMSQGTSLYTCSMYIVSAIVSVLVAQARCHNL